MTLSEVDTTHAESTFAQTEALERQLIGALGDASHPLGDHPESSPINQQWFPNAAERVPLKEWAEARCAEAGQSTGDLGLGFGAPRFGLGAGNQFLLCAPPSLLVFQPHTDAARRRQRGRLPPRAQVRRLREAGRGHLSYQGFACCFTG